MYKMHFPCSSPSLQQVHFMSILHAWIFQLQNSPSGFAHIYRKHFHSIPAPTPDSWLVCWSHRLSDFHSVGVSPWDLIFCCCWKVWSRPFKPDEEIPSYLPIFLPTILPIYLPKRIPLRSDPTYHPTNTNIVNFTFEIYKYSVGLFKSKHL